METTIIPEVISSITHFALTIYQFIYSLNSVNDCGMGWFQVDF